MFQVNDKIIHPKFGACKITESVKRQILGKLEDCFVLAPLFENPTHLSITVPLRSLDRIGLRRPLNRQTFGQIRKLLGSKPNAEVLKNQTSTPYIKEKIHSGEVVKIAEVLRDLFFKNRVENGKYSNVNRRAMYKQAFQMLANELAISKGTSVNEAGSWISVALKKHEKLFVQEAANL